MSLQLVQARARNDLRLSNRFAVLAIPASRPPARRICNCLNNTIKREEIIMIFIIIIIIARPPAVDTCSCSAAGGGDSLCKLRSNAVRPPPHHHRNDYFSCLTQIAPRVSCCLWCWWLWAAIMLGDDMTARVMMSGGKYLRTYSSPALPPPPPPNPFIGVA